jgi:hypothetical protein
VNAHAHSLDTSTALSVYYMPDLITPRQVIEALHEAGVKCVLMGAHGLGGWMKKPRATVDVDVLVGARVVKKAVRVLLAAFPHLEADDHDVVTRLRDRESKSVAIDVLKPNQALFRAALKETSTVEWEGATVQVPTLEMALALKFAPMVSLNREVEKKYQDAHDFITMVKANPEIDLDRLAELGDLVYSNGGKELVEKVGQARRGEMLHL